MRKVGIAGIGAIGSVVMEHLIKGINDLELVAVSETSDKDLPVPNLPLDSLYDEADILVECLPSEVAAQFAKQTLSKNKTLICISSSALLSNSEILDIKTGKLIIPSGAIAGLDGLRAVKQYGNVDTTITTTKKPHALAGAPFINENNVNLETIKEKTVIFEGNALEAAKGFPANVNVAATLSLLGNGPEKTKVQIIADPGTPRTIHEISLKSDISDIKTRIENKPDPNNPKSSQLTALSIISELEKL